MIQTFIPAYMPYLIAKRLNIYIVEVYRKKLTYEGIKPIIDAP